MEKAIIKQGDIETEKQKFHQHKRSISIKDINVIKNKIIIGFKDMLKNIPSCKFLPKILAFRKYFDETKYLKKNFDKNDE